MSVDRILELIDAGLQTPTLETVRDTSYNAQDRRDLCARCQRAEPVGGEFCAGCQAFLLDGNVSYSRSGAGVSGAPTDGGDHDLGPAHPDPR